MQVKTQIKLLQSVDSTNNYAMRQVHAGMAEHGAAWLARLQTEGKGQHGKQWEANAGENILMSILLDTHELTLQHQFGLSAAIAAASHAFIKGYVGTHVCIKWPNDIYWNDNKAGGILIENVIQGQTWKWSVVGLGININQELFAAHLSNPVSLRQITGLHYPVAQMAEELYQKVLFYWQQFVSGNQELVLHYYNNTLYKKGQLIRVHVQGRAVTGTLQGISKAGKLLLEETEEEFNYGDIRVEWEMASPAPTQPPPTGEGQNRGSL